MRLKLAFFILACSSLWAASANANGLFVTPAQLPNAARTTLLTQIQQARQSDPAIFAIVANLRSQVASMDAHKRGRLAVFTPRLKAMGPRALMPMLERLSVSADARGDLTDSAWLAWRLSLLEAVGTLRDARAESVLTAIFASPQSQYPLVRGATQALAKLGSPRVAHQLINASRVRNDKQLAIFSGMGHCRRTMVAERLAEAMASSTDGKTVKVIARSLGDIGSAWAWATPAVARSGEAAATRTVAVKALVDAFIAWKQSDVRKLITQAILVVDHPDSLSLLAGRKGRVDRATKQALEQLATRLKNSPLH